MRERPRGRGAGVSEGEAQGEGCDGWVGEGEAQPGLPTLPHYLVATLQHYHTTLSQPRLPSLPHYLVATLQHYHTTLSQPRMRASKGTTPQSMTAWMRAFSPSEMYDSAHLQGSDGAMEP